MKRYQKMNENRMCMCLSCVHIYYYIEISTFPTVITCTPSKLYTIKCIICNLRISTTKFCIKVSPLTFFEKCMSIDLKRHITYILQDTVKMHSNQSFSHFRFKNFLYVFLSYYNAVYNESK